jgi:hypothetical protein
LFPLPHSARLLMRHFADNIPVPPIHVFSGQVTHVSMGRHQQRDAERAVH